MIRDTRLSVLSASPADVAHLSPQCRCWEENERDAELTQPRGDGRKGGDVDAVLGGFGNKRERVGSLAHAGQSPQQRHLQGIGSYRVTWYALKFR